jgi:ketosteroid isomerase-like protein
MAGTTAKTEEQAIRDLVDAWLEASKRGDTATILNLMA